MSEYPFNLIKLCRKLLFSVLASIPILTCYQFLATEPFEPSYRLFLIVVTVGSILFVMNNWMDKTL